MKHIKELQDFGKGKTCLIIGGGFSLNEFDFEKVPKDVYVIACNRHMSAIADMIIYYDKDVNKYYENKPTKAPDGTLLVGFKHNSITHVCERCDYFYGYNDILFGDTGFHTLQFADGLFNFSYIYLIGFDYYTLEASYHWNEKESETQAMINFKTHSVNKVRHMYNEYEWINKIFNCSTKSKLKKFTYGLPWENKGVI